MKKLLIVKTGTTFSSIRDKHGDFDDFILKQMGMSSNDVIISSIYKNEVLPDINDISGIIITGSHSMVTDCDNWIFVLSQWLRNIIHKSIPTLGICYGHQLIAQAFGGIVAYHPKGKEIGTANISLTDDGKKDSLLGIIPNDFIGHVTHAQTIIKLPENAKLLAKNDFEQHHAFVIHDNIWGVQFHPEFNADITHEYIENQEKSLIEEGYNMEILHESVVEHAYGKILLKRFLELID